MAIDPHRRVLLLGLGAWPWAPVLASTARGRTPCLAATWLREGRYQAGFLLPARGASPLSLREIGAVEVPTRAHGVAQAATGHLLAVARRPGDWLLRWRGPGHAPQWGWIEQPRAFNGHVLASPDGQRLYTTETDLDSGDGLVGVRDALTLEKLEEWPTHGADPHQLAWDRHRPGHLLVANGGIRTWPETGRVKRDLDRMDASLVRLDAATGRQAGLWRLDDARLSLRHLAWGRGESGAVLGVALQAEHEDAAQRAQAPLLALFDGERLGLGEPAPRPLAGYGADIACEADGFVVSCTRAGGLAHFSAQGQWRGFTPLDEAGALAGGEGAPSWAAGGSQVLQWEDGAPMRFGRAAPWRIDNHWVLAS